MATKDLMEEIREIAFSCTLEEAFKAGICIQCHSMIAGELSDYPAHDLDVWLTEGLCPSCNYKSLKTESTTKSNQVRYSK